MSIAVDQPPPKKLSVSQTKAMRERRRKLLDRVARYAVAFGGFAIIASILAILIFILIEIVPLFTGAEVTELASFGTHQVLPENLRDEEVMALGINETREIAYVVTRTGLLQFFTIPDLQLRKSAALLQENQEVTAALQAVRDRRLLLGTSDGMVLDLKVGYNTTFYEGERSHDPEVSIEHATQVDPEGQAIKKIAAGGDGEETYVVAVLTADQRLLLFWRAEEASLFGDAEVDSSTFEIPKNWSDEPLSIAMDSQPANFYAGFSGGKIYHWTLSFDDGPRFLTSVVASENGAAVTELQFLIGDRTLMVGDGDGNVSSWFPVRDATSTSGWRLTWIRDLAPHDGSIRVIAPSARGKGLISADKHGKMRLQHSTSERNLATFGHEARVDYITYSAKADAALSLTDNQKITYWDIDNPHPEAGVKAFFGKVWYEGYEKPEHVWQSTGGSDEFEPKLSLVPLIFGSIKGTFYALIIAIPLAILGALYTSQFMHPSIRNYVKPTVEIMAALPSVVLGFLAGLWLAPRIEKVVPGMLTIFIVVPLLIVAASAIWGQFPLRVRNRLRDGNEAFLLIPVVILGIWFSLALSSTLETVLFDGDFKVWMNSTLNLTYDQRNALVVGIAMGFAVIPIIYTISEDALSNVPRTLVSGSLALGATRWQTAIRVVIPTAAAGIFSAVMIGLGRAVGETMIVLMATGNTPIMDWNIFNGFRTLSANIAVEIPEAPQGGTLYRVLFLAAMLLFIMTFMVNTAAEIVRQRLREKYQKL